MFSLWEERASSIGGLVKSSLTDCTFWKTLAENDPRDFWETRPDQKNQWHLENTLKEQSQRLKTIYKTLITFLTIENNNLKTHSDSSIKSDMGQHLFAILALFHYKCRWKHYPHYRHIIGRWKHIILPSAELSTDSATTRPPSGPTSTLTPFMQSLRGFLNIGGTSFSLSNDYFWTCWCLAKFLQQLGIYDWLDWFLLLLQPWGSPNQASVILADVFVDQVLIIISSNSSV